MPTVRRETHTKKPLRRKRPSGTELAEVPSYWALHSLGLTIGATILAAVLLSLLPLPDWLRPFPRLTSAPKESVVAALWPKRSHEQPQPAGAEGNEPAERAMVFEEMDLTGDEGGKPKLNDQEAKRWEALIKRAEAEHTPIVDPCVSEDCSKTALTPFFTALRGLADGTASESVRVVTLGTSLIASDHITDVTRRLLQTRHGSGGLGFMFVDRPTRNAGRTVRSGSASGGWVIEKVTDAKPLRLAGLGGVAFTAPGDRSQETTFLAVGTRRAELFLLTQRGGGVLRVLADGNELGQFPTDGADDQPLFQKVKVPPNATRLTLKTSGGPVRLDGVVLENGSKGVVFDSIGLPGATAQVLLREDAALFQAQLEHRKPSLVVLMIGGNDAFDISLRRYTASRAQESMQQLITRVKTAVPEAACLLAAPPDAGIWRMDKTIATRMETKQVGAYMRELAKTNGCAYYDMQAAMGGEGSVSRWWAAGLMNRDLVHPLGTGGDVMGYMLDAAIERAREKHDAAPKGTPRGGRSPAVRRPSGRTPHVAPHASVPRQVPDAGTIDTADGGVCLVEEEVAPAPSGYLDQPQALARFFQKLNQLETKGIGRVGIAQMGASHTAAQFFSDEVRRLLAERFGYAGRGFIAAGKYTDRLEAAGVARSLFGAWKISDALQVKTSGLTWGLTGIRAEAAVGSSMLVSFDEPSARPDDFSRVQVYYLDKPDGGTPEVRIDGKVIAIPEPSEQTQAAVRVLELGVPGSKHIISVRNPGKGPLSVFGVSHELMRPGIVYDALGLPGSTATTLASYAQQPLAQQLEARQVDLFVLFYGTNESSLSPTGIAEMRRSYPGVISTLRLSSPDAACLFLGPTDRMTKKGAKGWREVESINQVQAAVREIAAQNGCAFWSTRDVMGGKESIATWRKQKLANKDHVHLTEEGYQKLAGILFADLMAAYDAWSVPQ
jgi:lysophospholipase L1-like esterase